ncbi:Sec-independent protein translocase protein TatB [Sphingorhabdus sp. SMR4y]|uniref:Sec-independent protein translocase protein TatB n=1 Tax=Sphingorhabdus sp. SMR4y TaxID=2584094 RepID=UPI000B5CA0F1|nr:Sec-independent protein translocase protein TatB [Sphingorhabdus sp. SMR4y]ASK86863.1 Sec-independent protein translocase protein TatB [Sphingorhabdus sp. SMR4y]
MFDLSISEIAIIAIIAVVVIGPKELPRALATAGKWMAKGRGIMANFRTGLDAMVREAELQEMEKKWASENERIMREHPQLPDESAAEEPKMEPLDGPPVDQSAPSDTTTERPAHPPAGDAKP